MNHSFRMILLIPVIFLFSCATITKVDSGSISKISETMQVSVVGSWNKYERGFFDIERGLRDNFPTWTKDGLALDSLRFLPGITANSDLVTVQIPSGDRDRLRYRAEMNSRELVRLVEGYLSLDGSSVKTETIRPTLLSGVEGVNAEMTMLRKSDGLPMRGEAWLAVKGGRLYGIVYTAPSLGMYDRGVRDVRAIANSVTIVEKR